jgi:hypothetical protein
MKRAIAIVAVGVLVLVSFVFGKWVQSYSDRSQWRREIGHTVINDAANQALGDLTITFSMVERLDAGMIGSVNRSLNGTMDVQILKLFLLLPMISDEQQRQANMLFTLVRDHRLKHPSPIPRGRGVTEIQTILDNADPELVRVNHQTKKGVVH